MSTIEVNTIKPISGSSTITLGESGDTIALASGASQTLAANTPCFEAYLSSDQTGIPHETNTKVNFNAEHFDPQGVYNTSTYRFTPGVAGKYYLYASVLVTATNTNNNLSLRRAGATLYKNGAETSAPGLYYLLSGNARGGNEDAEFNTIQVQIHGIVESDTDDYFEIYGYGGNDNGTTDRKFEAGYSVFGAYKLIGA